jgi:hypothetical protein
MLMLTILMEQYFFKEFLLSAFVSVFLLWMDQQFSIHIWDGMLSDGDVLIIKNKFLYISFVL